MQPVNEIHSLLLLSVSLLDPILKYQHINSYCVPLRDFLTVLH